MSCWNGSQTALAGPDFCLFASLRLSGSAAWSGQLGSGGSLFVGNTAFCDRSDHGSNYSHCDSRGYERIGSFTSRLIPVMALLYAGGALAILILEYRQVPLALVEIFTGAVTGRAAIGGFAGAGLLQALRYGAARGVFSNEAGLGSASIVHAAAKTDHPVRQGLWGIMEVFIDTHLICTLTGLVLIVTGAWTTSLEGASMTAEAFTRVLHHPGELIVSIGLMLFAFLQLSPGPIMGEKF